MNKLLGILLLELCANFITCSDERGVKQYNLAASRHQPLAEILAANVPGDAQDDTNVVLSKISRTHVTVRETQVTSEMVAKLGLLDDSKTLQENINDAYRVHDFHTIESCLAKERYLREFQQSRSLYSGKTQTPYRSQLLSQEKLDDLLFDIVKDKRLSTEEKQELIKVYVKAGANINVRSINVHDRCAPLHYSARYNHYQITQQLLDHGANVNIIDADGRTPLHYAALSNAPKITRLLLDRGADVNAQDDTGMTALLYSAFFDADTTTPLLLNRGANMYAQDRRGWTSLHWGVSNNAKKTVPQLLAANTSVLIKNKEGEIPLDLAKTPDMKQLLLQGPQGRAARKIEAVYSKYQVRNSGESNRKKRKIE